MSAKSIKLIIGIILLLGALALYLFAGFAYWLAIIIAVIGLVFIVLAFTTKENLPVVSPQSQPETEVSVESEEKESIVEVPASAEDAASAPEVANTEESKEEESKPQV